MAVEMRLRGDGCRLVLRVDRYEYPDLRSGSDANWLTSEIELTAGATGAFSVTQALALRTDELEQFRDQLRRLDRELKGEATLEHLEEEVGITVRLSAGKGTLAGFVREHIGPELRFQDVETDQSFVHQALRELDAVVAAFPVRGDPWS